MRIKRRLCLALLMLAAVFAGGWLSLRQHPTARFELAVERIVASPEKRIGFQAELGTFADDQPAFGTPVTSAHVSRHCVTAYQRLRARFPVEPTTYYADVAGMPTQETIWQFSNYFVRLYATSSLDSDGAAIGVFPGRYETFRSGRLASIKDDGPNKFRPIAFAAPERFMQGR